NADRRIDTGRRVRAPAADGESRSRPGPGDRTGSRRPAPRMSPAGSGAGSPLAVDSLSMWQLTAGLPEQIATAIDVGRSVDNLPSAEQIDSVVVLGMGGSGIAGDVLAA